MFTFSDYKIDRLSKNCNGVIFEIEFHISLFHWFFWKFKRDITVNDLHVYFSFDGTYGYGHCSSTDSCNVCTVTKYFLVVTFCEDSLMFFFIAKTVLEDIEPSQNFICEPNLFFT